MIEFEDVGFRYGDRAVLAGLDLSIEEGSFNFLTGPSGAGKSTFLKLCYMSLLPDAGRLKLFGRETSNASAADIARLRRRVGVVFQEGHFLEHLTLTENVALPLRIAGRSAKLARDQVDELLDWVGMSHRADALPAELSGGERQRAALARAVIAGPDMVIADEPTGNLDRESANALLDLLVALHGSGRTVLIATHDMDLIRAAKGRTNAHVMRLAHGAVSKAGVAL